MGKEQELLEALKIARAYVAQAVKDDGGIDNCEIGDRLALERIDAALTSRSEVVDVPDIKLTIFDFLEDRDGDMGVVSTDEERSNSAIALHDAIQTKLASPPAVAAGGVTEERVERAIVAWRRAVGLSEGQYLQVTRYDKASDGSVTDILLPFGDTMIEAMRAALTAALAVRDEGIREGWQPIETAPKDGTPIILFWPNIPAGAKAMRSVDKRFTGISVGWFEASEYGVGFINEGDMVVPVNQDDCTHWQPLPTPPSRGEGV